MLPNLRDRRLLWPALMTLIGVVVTLSLAHWQWQRRAWKNELIATIEARTAVAPLPPEAWANFRCRTVEDVGLELSCEYMKVTLRGTFDHTRERHVFINVPRQPNGIGGPGYWVFTPMKLEGVDNSFPTFVNRGFVPEGAKAIDRREQGQLAGTVEITGLLRSAEPRTRFTGRNDEAHNIWYLRSPFEFLGQEYITNVLPRLRVAAPPGPHPWHFYVDQISPVPPGGLPLPLAGQIALPNRHLEYALTWAALAATLLTVFVVFAVRR